MGHIRTYLLPGLSLSNILLLPSSHCFHYCKEKFGMHLRNVIFLILFYFLKTVEHGITCQGVYGFGPEKCYV
jgi:hypothetical protein